MEQFDEIFTRAATALYHEQLEGEASAHAMLDKEDERSGIDVVDGMFFCLREYAEARKRGEYMGLNEYVLVLLQN